MHAGRAPGLRLPACFPAETSGSETETPRLPQRSSDGARRGVGRPPVNAGGASPLTRRWFLRQTRCFSNPFKEKKAVYVSISLQLRPRSAGAPRKNNPLSVARAGLGESRSGAPFSLPGPVVQHRWATWLILPVAYACLKD